MAVAPAARAQPVDLELVLAVDASGSVDEKEYDLQLQGIAAAAQLNQGGRLDWNTTLNVLLKTYR